MYRLNPEILSALENRSTDPKFSLGVASRLSDTSVYSIRQYVDKGLLIPFKTSSNRHLFSEVDIMRLHCIKKYLTIQGLNVAGIKAVFALIPCWTLKGCSQENRDNCDAYYSTTYSCWEASHKSDLCKNSDCRVCEVYRLSENCKDLKELFRNLL